MAHQIEENRPRSKSATGPYFIGVWRNRRFGLIERCFVRSPVAIVRFATPNVQNSVVLGSSNCEYKVTKAYELGAKMNGVKSRHTDRIRLLTTGTAIQRAFP